MGRFFRGSNRFSLSLETHWLLERIMECWSSCWCGGLAVQHPPDGMISYEKTRFSSVGPDARKGMEYQETWKTRYRLTAVELIHTIPGTTALPFLKA